ncbi:hypothetical protein EMCRGX_G019373 [Ephydatia muelleri]
MSQYFGSLLYSFTQRVVFVYNLLYLSGFELEWIDSESTEEQSTTRPNCSYSCMISMALNSSKAQRLHLSKIIRFIELRFPYYSSNHGDWKVEIRRTLSQSGYFRKMRTSRGADGRFRVLYWGFNPNTKAAAEEEIARWLAGGRVGWAREEHGNNVGEKQTAWYLATEKDGRNEDHTDQFPDTVGHKRPRNDMAAQDMTTEEEGCFTRLPPKRRWMQANWSPNSTGHSVDINKRDRHVSEIEKNMMASSSQNIEFDGLVQMDIEAHTLPIG